MLTLVEQQLFLARSRRRAPPHGITTTTASGSSSVTTSDALSPANSTAPVAPFEAAVGINSAAASATAATASAPPPQSEHGGGGGGGGGNSGGLSSILIRLDCAWLLLLMGIQVRAEGLSERSLSRPAMLLFTHVSTLDAVVILGTLPRALCAVVKVCGKGVNTWNTTAVLRASLRFLSA